jgi:hypothetical protein
VKPSEAPGATWEVRLRWGNRRLAAELLGLERRRLTLGNAAGDDVDTGNDARLVCEVTEQGALLVQFSTGVQGTVSVAGDDPITLGQLTQRGLATEAQLATGAAWTLTLRQEDRATLKVGALLVDLRRARGRYQRLHFDYRVLVVLGLALLAVGLLFVSLLTPAPPMHLPPVRPARTRPAAP